MKICGVFQTQGPGSPRSSPSHTISRPIPTPIHSDSAGTTPTHTPQDSLMGVGGDVQEAFAQGNAVRALCSLDATMKPHLFMSMLGPRRNLRNDLLLAADSITNTMSSLVKELNSGRRNGGRKCLLVWLALPCNIFYSVCRGWKWDWEHGGLRFWTLWPSSYDFFRSFLFF